MFLNQTGRNDPPMRLRLALETVGIHTEPTRLMTIGYNLSEPNIRLRTIGFPGAPHYLRPSKKQQPYMISMEMAL